MSRRAAAARASAACSRISACAVTMAVEMAQRWYAWNERVAVRARPYLVPSRWPSVLASLSRAMRSLRASGAMPPRDSEMLYLRSHFTTELYSCKNSAASASLKRKTSTARFTQVMRIVFLGLRARHLSIYLWDDERGRRSIILSPS